MDAQSLLKASFTVVALKSLLNAHGIAYSRTEQKGRLVDILLLHPQHIPQQLRLAAMPQILLPGEPDPLHATWGGTL